MDKPKINRVNYNRDIPVKNNDSILCPILIKYPSTY